MEVILITIAIVIAPLIAAYFVNNKITKGILCFLSLLGFFVLAFLGALFFSGIFGINSVWLPFSLCGLIYIIAILFVWRLFNVKTRRIIAISIAGVAVLLTAVFVVPTVYRSSIPVAGEEVQLTDYSPFGNYWYVDGVLTHHGTKAANLNENSTLKITGELPRLDGATALYPLYAAFVRATYPEPEPALDIPEYFPYADLRDNNYNALVVCSRTANAFENLIDGYADIIFLMGISEEQAAIADQRGLELVLTPVGKEAFVFFVNSRNSVNNLSAQDIQRIYSGEITNWQEVGGGNNSIRAYQRPDESGSQTMLKQIMGDVPLAPALLDDIYDTMMGMYERVANYRNYRNSLGYSFLYYIRDMIGENKVKFLSIDGAPPTPDNIFSGVYPFANDFYAITVKSDNGSIDPELTENIDMFIEWILSSQGQFLVEATGYVPVR